jgi:hypothetical protein
MSKTVEVLEEDLCEDCCCSYEDCECEVDLYDLLCDGDDGEPIYLCDGVWLYPDGSTSEGRY